jgi:hypothetical protein
MTLWNSGKEVRKRRLQVNRFSEPGFPVSETGTRKEILPFRITPADSRRNIFQIPDEEKVCTFDP